ncbi:hypothetical protein SAMN05892883_2091 [Jatrophihabitans sp. GAS493]|uniref:hypothetical protein n=1 Tax=Jatrophihabitans sp. GAS493 TaxID=1907575 RepID=UPI000BB7E47A|nr:hypothetical protein [Jatrophihabitans sp. GAS493]SOD72744.1 hypothetical protein SAMN05892883_2091 [Jatrophihabitans sp. GAS493]
MSFVAQWGSYCCECLERFGPGTELTYKPDPHNAQAGPTAPGLPAHAPKCPEIVAETRDQACPSCHLIHAGECF